MFFPALTLNPALLIHKFGKVQGENTVTDDDAGCKGPTFVTGTLWSLSVQDSSGPQDHVCVQSKGTTG